MAPLFILSGPSGSGKSTVLGRVLAEGEPPLHLAVSATTRPPRPKEKDGVHYHFWTHDRFAAEIVDDAFLEWAEVFDNFYGTPRAEVEPFRKRGIGVILDIDVQGATQVRKLCPEAVTVFLRTSSLAAYEERLTARGTETADSIRRRVTGASHELERSGEYQYQVINDELDKAVAELRTIVRRHFPRSDHAG